MGKGRGRGGQEDVSDGTSGNGGAGCSQHRRYEFAYGADRLRPTASTPFADLITDAVGQVNQLEQQAHAAVTGLMTGSGVDVHQAMIATQKAGMAFELALAVRNKAVQAYQR